MSENGLRERGQPLRKPVARFRNYSQAWAALDQESFPRGGFLSILLYTFEI